ncbi:hypothetical protein Rcae01_03313 [Novipirellula caenicola]|uniref:Uncharacterized protein n=1 Tax=Novipirellula caenicola TaxID=1536901 RepID=A0ABP9VRV6_9BACT
MKARKSGQNRRIGFINGAYEQGSKTGLNSLASRNAIAKRPKPFGRNPWLKSCWRIWRLARWNAGTVASVKAVNH